MILAKILAVVLALSQISTRPDAVKTHFEPGDTAEVVALLRAGCGHMRKVFELEDLQLDDLVDTAMLDPTALAGDNKAFHGINFNDLAVAYKQFCKNETVANSPIDIGEVIAFFNLSADNLPDHTRLKGMKLAGPTEVVDSTGAKIAELYEPGQRRVFVPLADIPKSVQQAFIAAEDKRFYQHTGIDERGLVRAFVSNMMRPGRPQGGSTITQQVVKNLIVGDDVTYERKIREIIVASRLEKTLSKDEILELYLNAIYLGRNSWGVELAARSWFGKSVKDLDLVEGALLAGVTKGPNYFSPDRSPERARERLVYVIDRLAEDGIITADIAKRAHEKWPRLVAYDRGPENGYFVDYLRREAKTLAPLQAIAGTAASVRATIDPRLQRAAEAALQEGLAQYEISSGRVSFQGAEANLGEAIKALAAEPGAEPAWKRALVAWRPPLSDVQWEPAIIVDKGGKAGGPKAGLRDGRVLPLRASGGENAKLALNDVVYVRLRDEKGKGARADLRVKPVVQGSAIVLDNKTGRVLAMAGGFSYGLSQLNRTSQTRRQPGSSIKPLTYLAALQQGLQPNTLVRDEPVTLPPINGSMREQDYWTPKNYDGGSSGVLTLRRALENSKNLATVGLLDSGAIAATPQMSLDKVCSLMIEAQLYADCQRYYPIVLGAQPVRLIDLAAFYAAVANEGGRPTPHAIERVDQDGRVVHKDDMKPLTWLGGADRVAFYQLKTMLQGVVARGTAASISRLSPFVAGKTGTSDDENDAWFAGFSNDVTVAIWVGYDNANGRRTLGGGSTGGKVAVPIFEQIMKAVWAGYAPQVALAPPSAEAKRQLAAVPIDLASGTRVTPGEGRGNFIEQFRVDGRGRMDDTQYRMVSPDEAAVAREQQDLMRGDQDGYDRSTSYYGNNNPYGNGPYNNGAAGGGPYGRVYGNGAYGNSPPSRGLFGQPLQEGPIQSPLRGLFGGGETRTYGDPRTQGRAYGEPRSPQGEQPERRRRIDPDYLWGERRYN